MMFSLSFFLPTFLLSLNAATPYSGAYVYHQYQDILTSLSSLASQYPRFVRVFDALDRWPHIADRETWAKCGSAPCRVQVVQLADFHLHPTPTALGALPEVFISGALHGDETIGPQVVVELAQLLAQASAAAVTTGGSSEGKNQELLYLMQQRSLFMIAMTNPHGYYHHRREERGMDPNRDFPYLQSPRRCMTTVTARVVNELFREHLFRGMITFHGGIRALSYEWGSRNHAHGRFATEPPDDRGQVEIAKVMQIAAGKEGPKRWFYPSGRMTDLVFYRRAKLKVI